MKAKFINDNSQVEIEISPENETECVALRLFCNVNDPQDDANIIICTSTEE